MRPSVSSSFFFILYFVLKKVTTTTSSAIYYNVIIIKSMCMMEQIELAYLLQVFADDAVANNNCKLDRYIGLSDEAPLKSFMLP